MPNESSLRERKKAALRDRLSVTTVLLARERGLENVRVEDIVGAVGVSRRTFGNYFSSKEDAIADRHVQRIRAAAARLTERPLEEHLWTSIAEALLVPYEADDIGAPSRDEQSGLLTVLAKPDMQSAVDRGARKANELFAGAIASRLRTAPDDALPRLLSAAALSTLLTTLELWVAQEKPEPVHLLLRAAFDRLGTGFNHIT